MRSTQDVTARPGDPTVTVLPHGFFERYRGEVGMVEGNFLVDLVDEPAARRTFSRELRAAFTGDEVPFVDGLGSTAALDQSMSVLETGLLAFALVVYLAGAAAVGQAASRAAAAREPEQLALAGLGLGRTQRWLDAWVPLMLGGGVGVAVAGVLAVAASPQLPVGLARRVDPDLGLSLDPVALASGAALLLPTVAALGAWSAWRSSKTPLSSSPAGTRAPSGRLAQRLTRTTRPSATVGLGMVMAQGRGTTAVPVRTALSGVLLGVTGLVAALVFGASMLRLLDTPARYGWPWDVSLATTGDDPQPLADRPDTTAVAAGVFNATAELEGTPTFAFALDPVEGDLAPTLTAGRAPRGRGEVALAADTQRRLGHPATVQVLDRAGAAHEFDVVGTVVVPSIDDPVPMAEGAYFPMEGMARLGLDDAGAEEGGFRQTVVRFAAGTDVRAEVAALEGVDDEPSFPQPPQEVERLDQVAGLPGVLAVFLAALGLIAVWQALWQTVRRRRREVAVLRTIGLDRRQIVAAFGWQAGAIALAGTVAGLPLGLLLGRTAWTAVADSLGVASDIVVPTGVALVLAAALVVPTLLGAAFGARAGRRTAGADLRAE